MAAGLVKEKKYSFPMLVGARLFWDQALRSPGVPINWYIDPQGRMSDEPNFGGRNDFWVSETLKALEKIAAASSREK